MPIDPKLWNLEGNFYRPGVEPCESMRGQGTKLQTNGGCSARQMSHDQNEVDQAIHLLRSLSALDVGMQSLGTCAGVFPSYQTYSPNHSQSTPVLHAVLQASTQEHPAHVLFADQSLDSPPFLYHGLMEGTLRLEGEPEHVITIPVAGKLSEGILHFKAEVSNHLNAYIQNHNLSKEDENLMEEVISEDEEVSKQNKKKQSSRQRKLDKRKRGLQYPEG